MRHLSPFSIPEPDEAGWFDLSAPVGLRFPSDRADAIRVEGILANSGDLDLTERGGPTGYWGLAQDAALRRYQRRNGLAVDGWSAPGGETISHMRDAFGPLLDGHAVPTPDDIDAHFEDIGGGGPGTIALVPRVKPVPIPMPYLPDIGEQGRASNAAQIDWLTANRAGLDGVPAQLARYVRELGDPGLAQARDFFDQFGARRPGEADALLAGVMRELPDPEMRARFLGVDSARIPPVGIHTKEMRIDDPYVAPIPKPFRPGDEVDAENRRAFAAESAAPDDGGAGPDAGNDPQSAQAPPSVPGFDKPPAYRADVFKSQPGVWEGMLESVAGDASLGDGQRRAYMAIFAGEGGMRPDPEGNAISGITQNHIDRHRRNGTWPAELDHVKKPSDLRPDDIKPAYRHYFDHEFQKIGGAKTLDDIGNPEAAAAIADTLFRSGAGQGAAMIQEAAKAAGAKIDADGVFGSRTLEAIKEIAGSEERTKDFLDKLTERREEGARNGERPRFNFFRRK